MLNVLFDLDGTLTDPREGIVACLQYALLGLGHNYPSDLDLRVSSGPPLQESFAVLLHSTDTSRLMLPWNCIASSKLNPRSQGSASHCEHRNFIGGKNDK
jgi:phosphoglycolate phosphatase-like HAD superfamily hydrolase